MKRAALFLLVALTADAGSGRFGRFTERCAGGRSSRGLGCDDLAFFEFAPASGTGMGSACSCAAVTGAKGEAVTFTRTGDATCSKQGLATTGIANGDLVVCTGNQPRVESSGGVLGLRVEGARTNNILRSEEFDNPAWQRGGIINPPTPNYATSPYGTATATRVEVTSCAGAVSALFQDYTGTAATWTASIYLRGTSGSGTISLYYFDTTAGAGDAVQCAFVSTEWRRCSITRTFANTTHRVGFGCINAFVTGNANTGAADFLAATAQSEAGAYATSPIPTVAAAVTRNAEAPTLTLASSVGPTASIAASMQFPSTAVGAVNVFALGAAGDNMTLYRTSDTAAGFQINATITAPVVASMGTAVQRAALADASGVRSAFWNGGSVSAPAASMAAGVTAVWLGRNVSGLQMDGIITRACADPDPTRCR